MKQKNSPLKDSKTHKLTDPVLILNTFMSYVLSPAILSLIFTSPGLHPETGRTLRELSKYMFDKYVCPQIIQSLILPTIPISLSLRVVEWKLRRKLPYFVTPTERGTSDKVSHPSKHALKFKVQG